MLERLYASLPGERELVRLALSAIGRGGEGDVGQRIRDEILVVQQNNNAKGGMLEEWHQKLHNNTSPDDVVICQALLDYLKADLDLGAYWARLEAEGVSRERLRSYDRPIVSEPALKPEQKEGLIRDLGAYLKTLKAVHSGADLESAAAAVLGFKLDAMRVSAAPAGPATLQPLSKTALVLRSSELLQSCWAPKHGSAFV